MRVISERQLAVMFGALQVDAVIWGHDASGQAEQIISQVAHPSVREELRRAGRDLGLGV
jgi:hypothetical protein